MPKKLRMVDCECCHCEWQGETLVDLSKEKPHGICEKCGELANVVNTIGAPVALKASYPDGYSRWPAEKARAKLNVERVQHPFGSPERKAIEKEMKEVEKLKSKDKAARED